MWQCLGLNRLVPEGSESLADGLLEFGLKGSKVMTVPQFRLLSSFLVLLRSTQGSGKV